MNCAFGHGLRYILDSVQRWFPVSLDWLVTAEDAKNRLKRKKEEENYFQDCRVIKVAADENGRQFGYFMRVNSRIPN
jgi:hypothetical protein